MGKGVRRPFQWHVRFCAMGWQSPGVVPGPRSSRYQAVVLHAHWQCDVLCLRDQITSQPPRVRYGRSEGELVEEYRGLLQDTVRLQMRSDVPVGLFLSSGIDSGVLLALMS